MTMHLSIHGDVFTRTQRIVDWISSRTGWPVVTDRDLIDEAGRRFNIPAERLEDFIKKPNGVLNRLTHGTERSMAYLKAVMADSLEQAPTIFHGTMGFLSARQSPRIMNVLVTADKKFRVHRAQRTTSGTEPQIRKTIERLDRREFRRCRLLVGSDRFDADAYDLVVPSDSLDRESAGQLILKQLMHAEMRASADAADRVADFKLATDIQVLLSKKGHPVSVDAEKGLVRLTVERPVILLNRLARKLERHVRQVDGVRQVQTKAGAGCFRADIYRRSRFEVPFEMAFRSFTRSRRNLHDRAVERLPATARLLTRQQKIARVAQQIEAITSP